MEPVPSPELPEPAEFRLGGDSPPRQLSDGILSQLEIIYSTGRRQLRRWWKEGAPIHDPALMPAWWESERAAGRKTWSLPEKILRAAQHSRPHPPLPSPAASPAPFQKPARPGSTAGPAINLEDFGDPEEGAELSDLKQRRAAWSHQFREKLATGIYDDLLENKINKLAVLISQLQSRIEARLIKAGRYVLMDHVASDVAKAAEMIRQMGETEGRRLIELCPDLPPAIIPQILDAQRRLTESRARVFRTLKNLRTPGEAALELEAA